MNYRPIKNAMNYLTDVYYGIKDITQKIGNSLFPSSGLENRLAFAGIPNGFVQGNSIVDEVYSGLYLFSKGEKHRRPFDDQARVYAGTNKRPHGNVGNSESIGWNNPGLDDNQRARLILEAAGLKKSDL